MVFVNDAVSFRTEGTERVISVHGVLFAHYSVEDKAAEFSSWARSLSTGHEISLKHSGNTK